MFFFLQDLPRTVLGGVLALASGGFLYLAYVSRQERQWGLLQSLAVAVVGAGLTGAIQLAVV